MSEAVKLEVLAVLTRLEDKINDHSVEISALHYIKEERKRYE